MSVGSSETKSLLAHSCGLVISKSTMSVFDIVSPISKGSSIGQRGVSNNFFKKTRGGSWVAVKRGWVVGSEMAFTYLEC